MLGAAGPGSLVGSILASRSSRGAGIGRTVIGGGLGIAGGQQLVPLAGGPVELRLAMLMASQFLSLLSAQVANVNLQAVRQAVTHPGALGRVSAMMSVILIGAAALGALAGGALGERSDPGPRWPLATAGMMLGVGHLVVSPISSLHSAPSPIIERG